MEHTQDNEIIKALNDNRNKLSGLYSLYNSSLITAEENRISLSSFYEQMIDFRNDLNGISNEIFAAKKADRSVVFTKNKIRIKKLNTDIQQTNQDFKSAYEKFNTALKECGSLKTEYKHEVARLVKEFKDLASKNEVEPILIKGYKQQVRIIKAILDKIEMLISDYNVKRNKTEADNKRFADLYYSVNELVTRMQSIV